MSRGAGADGVNAVLARVLGFSLGLILLFTLMMWLPPQRQGEAPEDLAVDSTQLSQEQFVALGESIFNGKGMCALCHQPPPAGRAPDIRGMNLMALAAERLADPRYRGGAKDAVAYLRESLLNPSVYVVAGWGVVGEEETRSPMPAVDKPPVSLTADEIDAVIAYLQAKDGNPVTMLPSKENGRE